MIGPASGTTIVIVVQTLLIDVIVNGAHAYDWPMFVSEIAGIGLNGN